MSQEKKRMKIALIIAIVLVVVLIVVSSIYSTGKVNPSSEKSVTVTNNNSNTNVTSKGSASNNSVKPNSSQPSKSIGNKSAKDLAPINGVFTNASSSSSPNDQNNPKPAEKETATGNVVPPDGRIYTGGEGPYAYIPTCSQKGQPLPIAPLTPND
jgi:predicted carbohydrate-binding protein with CBM5 and CBM33 domain